MTILESVLSFAGASIASGLTWDVLKYSGQKLIQGFKKKFIENKCFQTESECDQFWEDISTKAPNSKKNPYRDVRNIYEDIAEDGRDDFMNLFEQWLGENTEEFKKIESTGSQHVSVQIGRQENYGAGTIVNAGIINKH